MSTSITAGQMAVAGLIGSVCFLFLAFSAKGAANRIAGWFTVILFASIFIRLGMDWGREGVREADWVIAIDVVSLLVLAVARGVLQVRRRKALRMRT